MAVRRTVAMGLALALGCGAAALALDPVAGVGPLADRDFYDDGRPPAAKVELGRMLFFDRVLSGNRNIACASCHHPTLGTGDGLALSLGEGGEGLGPERAVVAASPVLGRVPRNAQPLYNLGAKEFASLFHDGRVERDAHDNWDSGFWSPAREQLPAGLDNVLAAQAMFPVLSSIEMAGHKGENEVATKVAVDELAGPGGAWDLLAARLRAIPEYVALFKAAYPERIERAEDITFVDAANAIAVFEAVAFRADGSPFDHYLRTRHPGVLSPEARRGMELFYGKAGCAACHGGPLQTDQQFHAIAMPQIGPGKDDGFDHEYWQATGFVGRLEDFGRYRVTYRAEDRYRFRTPSLRNVELTAPYGHSGAYAELADVIRHHLDPEGALAAYEVVGLEPLAHVVEATGEGSRLLFRPVNPARIDGFNRRDRWVQGSARLRAALAAANELAPAALDDGEVADLVAFLHALTDPRSRDQADLVPERVPSGLPVDR